MRTTCLKLGLALALVALPGLLLAGETNTVTQAKAPRHTKAKTVVTAPKAKAKTKPAETTITGSLIKKPIKRNGMITDGTSQVLVLDQDAFRAAGAADIMQALNRRGVRH